MFSFFMSYSTIGHETLNYVLTHCVSVSWSCSIFFRKKYVLKHDKTHFFMSYSTIGHESPLLLYYYFILYILFIYYYVLKHWNTKLQHCSGIGHILNNSKLEKYYANSLNHAILGG